jgi:hypothetical protein
MLAKPRRDGYSYSLSGQKYPKILTHIIPILCYTITNGGEQGATPRAEGNTEMTTKNNNLTPFNACNAREIQMMVSKAVCAYANATRCHEVNPKSANEIALMAEYEATVRCIEMFVRESLVEVCQYVIAEAEEMMA